MKLVKRCLGAMIYIMVDSNWQEENWFCRTEEMKPFSN